MKTKVKKSKNSSSNEHQVRDGHRRKKLKPMPKEKFNWRLIHEED